MANNSIFIGDLGTAGFNGTTVTLPGSSLAWPLGTSMREASSGVLGLFDAAGTSFGRLQFGGTTSSFPSLKRNGAQLQARLADDSASASLSVNNLLYLALANAVTANILVSFTAPTISSGFGTTPSIAASNGSAAFTINVGTGGTTSTGVIGLPTAATGWIVFATDLTTPGVNVTKMTAASTTSATLTNYNSTTGLAAAWGSGDVLYCIAMAY